MPQLLLKLSENKLFYWKSWSRLYIATLCCWLPFIINFLWGNHDWQWVKEYTPLSSGLFEGRYTQFILPTILTEGTILPIASILLGLAFNTAAAVLLFHLLNISPKPSNYIFLGLILTSSPYTISWLYFAFLILSCLSWPFFIILGFFLLTGNTSHKKINFLCASILFSTALGGYPPVINMMGVIFFALFLNDLCYNKTPTKKLINKYLYIGSNLLLSVFLFCFALHIINRLNLLNNTYNTSSITLSAIPEKILPTIEIAFKQFIITKSFIGSTYKYIMLAFVLGALIELIILSPKTLVSYGLLLIGIAGILLSTVITVFSAKNTIYTIYEARIEFYGLLYIYIFAAFILWKSHSNIIRNITYIAGLLIIYCNFHTAAYAAKVWSLGFKAESLLSERIIQAIEQNPQFDIKQPYTFVQGGQLQYRPRFYLKDNNTLDSYTLTAPYIPWHLPSKAYKFYYPRDIFNQDFDIFWSYVNPDKIYMTPDLANYLRYKAQPWPHSNALYIKDRTIILTLTTEGKYKAINWINYYWQNYPHN